MIKLRISQSKHRATKKAQEDLGASPAKPFSSFVLLVPFRGSLFVRLRFSPPEHVETNGGDQHSAFDNVLRPVLNIQQRHAVIQASQNQRAEHGSKHRATSAHQTGAAYDA